MFSIYWQSSMSSIYWQSSMFSTYWQSPMFRVPSSVVWIKLLMPARHVTT